MTWTPAAILPNLRAKQALDGDVIAIAPSLDPRVSALCYVHPKFKDLLSRFTDAFKRSLDPLVLIVRDDVLPKIARVEPLASFRDLAALSVVPYARALGIVYPQPIPRIYYSNWFWFYPWMLGTDQETLVASTPAIEGFHVVDQFHGQCSPDLQPRQLNEIDQPLFEALLTRWKVYYLDNLDLWADRALFRSLNMAAQAAQLPGGIDTTIYDLGRMVALWVSAFEILAHPGGSSKSGLQAVYALLDRVPYLNSEIADRQYPAYINGKASMRCRSLPCWLYGNLYQARNNFLHGNSIGEDALNPGGTGNSLFWFPPYLYRLALTGFLPMADQSLADVSNNLEDCDIEAYARLQGFQGMMERALRKAGPDHPSLTNISPCS